MKKLLSFLIINFLTLLINAALPKLPPPPPMLPPAASALPKPFPVQPFVPPLDSVARPPIMPAPPAQIMGAPMQPITPILPKQTIAPTIPGQPVVAQAQAVTMVGAPGVAAKQIKDDLGSITIENLSTINATIATGTGTINNLPNQKIFINKTIEAKKKKEEIILYNFIASTDIGGQAFNALTSLDINGETVSLPNNQENPTYAGDTIYINNINNKWQIVAKPAPAHSSTTLKPTLKAAQTINAAKQPQAKSIAAKAIRSATNVQPKLTAPAMIQPKIITSSTKLVKTTPVLNIPSIPARPKTITR